MQDQTTMMRGKQRERPIQYADEQPYAAGPEKKKLRGEISVQSGRLFAVRSDGTVRTEFKVRYRVSGISSVLAIMLHLLCRPFPKDPAIGVFETAKSTGAQHNPRLRLPPNACGR